MSKEMVSLAQIRLKLERARINLRRLAVASKQEDVKVIYDSAKDDIFVAKECVNRAMLLVRLVKQKQEARRKLNRKPIGSP